MTLFTGKGDDGMTKKFGCNQRLSKSSAIAEALGSLDETNSFLGLCKVQSAYLNYNLGKKPLSEIIHEIQKNLFIIQAELAGADKTIEEGKVKEMEDIIDKIERQMPPIKSFFISGGPTELETDQLSGAGLGVVFDIARTIARRAERRVVAVAEAHTVSLFEENESKNVLPETDGQQIGKYTLSYLNRLSSILYALARYSNHLSNIPEEAPDYR